MRIRGAGGPCGPVSVESMKAANPNERPADACHSFPVIRGALIVLIGLATAWPQVATAQVCRRVCRSGEVRDANRCCVSRRTLLRRRGSGSLRVEADVGRARVKVGNKWHRVKLPATLRRVPAGKHAVLIKAGKRTWRGVTRIRPRQTTRLFASVNGGEWRNSSVEKRLARAILGAALRAQGPAALIRRIPSVTFTGVASPHARINKGAIHSMSWLNPSRLHWVVVGKGKKRGSTGKRVRRVVVRAAHGISITNIVKGKRTDRSRVPTPEDVDLMWRFPTGVLLHHSDATTRAALLPPVKLEGALVDVVQIARADGTARTRLYIHRTTKMLRRVQAIDRGGAFLASTELSDYRTVKGIAVPYRWTYEGNMVDWQRIYISTPASARVIPKAPTSAVLRDVIRIDQLYFHSYQPELAHLNRDRVGDLYGLCNLIRSERLPNGKGTLTRGLWICGLDGRTMKQLWRLGPVAHGGKMVPLPGARASVIDYPVKNRARVRVYDLRRRRVAATLQLTKKVRQFCAGPKGEQLWLWLNDRSGTFVNTRTGKATEAPRPAWCPRRVHVRCPRMKRQARCLTVREHRALPKLSGVYWDYSVAAGRGRRAAFGYTRPGTSVPVVAVWNRRHKQLWTRKVIGDTDKGRYPRHVDVVGGRMIFAYMAARTVKVVCLSAQTGKRLWATQLPYRGLTRLRVTPTRVFVTDWGRKGLSMLDARTGRKLGVFGGKVTTTRPALPSER